MYKNNYVVRKDRQFFNFCALKFSSGATIKIYTEAPHNMTEPALSGGMGLPTFHLLS